jgi:hypothetical protein
MSVEWACDVQAESIIVWILSKEYVVTLVNTMSLSDYEFTKKVVNANLVLRKE